MPISILVGRYTEPKNASFMVKSYIGEIAGKNYNKNAIANDKNIRLKNSKGVDKREQYYNHLGELIITRNIANYLGSLIQSFEIENSTADKRSKDVRNSLSDNKLQHQLNSLSCNFTFTEKQQEGKKKKIKNGFIAFKVERPFINTLSSNRLLEKYNSLSSNFKTTERIALSLNRYLQNINEIKDKKTWEFLIKNCLIDLESHKKHKILGALTATEDVRCKNEIAEGLYSKKAINNSIDSYKEKRFIARNTINETGITKNTKIRNAIESFGVLLKQGMNVKIDNIDVTGIVKNGNISLIGDGIYSSATIEIATDKPVFGNTLTINIDDKEYSFTIEESDFDIKGHRQSIWGRPETARLYEPYALKQDYAFKNMMAKDIVLSVAVGFDIDWQIDDWFIDIYKKDKAYPMDIIKEIAEAGGGVVRCLPDRKIHIVYPYTENNTADIDLILNLQIEKQIKRFDGVKVIFGDDDGTIATSDKTILKPYEWATVKVYSKVPYTIQTNADAYYKARSGVVERITEKVKCTNGKGEISKPVLKVIDSGGLKVYGRTVLCEGCDVVSVVYETIYDEWKLTKYKESVAIFCSIETQNSVTLTNGQGNNIKEVKNSIANSNTARKIAIKELAKVIGLQKIRVTTPYDNDFCSADRIKTEFGDGYVTKNIITFASNPLKILNKMEAVIWRRP